MEAIPLPNRASVQDLGQNKYVVTLDPLYPGYGDTIGNAMRRVLLSSMPGAAVTAVKIKFVDHEFSTIPHVKEDVIQIILNLKQLRVKSFSSEPMRLQLKVKGERAVTAADIKETDQVKVVNKDLHIATLDNKNGEFDMELVVEQGKGYSTVESRENQKPELGMIAIDAIFTPIKSAYYNVSNMRVGQLTNYNKLEIFLETDGTITGREVADIAAHILVDHFTMIFSSDFSVQPQQQQPELAAGSVEMPEAGGEPSVNEVENSTLSTRAKNALNKNGITSMTALQSLSNEQIGSLSGLGEKTVNEIIEFLGR